jgi:opacity protein-like surface antigen
MTVHTLMNDFRSLALCFVAFGVAIPAAAQNTPVVEVSGGYQALHANEENDAFSISRGWYADVAYNLSNVIGIVGEIGGGSKTAEESLSNEGVTVSARGDIDVYEFMAGARLSSRRNPKAAWFGQVLVGRVRASVDATVTGTDGTTTITESASESETYFGLQLGGGVNLALTDRVGLRIGVDSLRVFHEGENANVFRLAAGIVLPFGAR